MGVEKEGGERGEREREGEGEGERERENETPAITFRTLKTF